MLFVNFFLRFLSKAFEFQLTEIETQEDREETSLVLNKYMNINISQCNRTGSTKAGLKGVF